MIYTLLLLLPSIIGEKVLCNFAKNTSVEFCWFINLKKDGLHEKNYVKYELFSLQTAMENNSFRYEE